MNNATLVERRKEERILLNENSMFIDVSLQCPKGYQITKPIVDISASGLSFKLSEEEGYLLSGTTLNDVRIRDLKYEKNIKTAVVRYSAPIKESGKTYYKIGIEFIIKPFEKSILRRKLLNSYKIRMPRFDAKLFSSLLWNLSFESDNEKTIATEIMNFSKSGIAFCVEKKSPSIVTGSILNNSLISIDDEILYKGRLRIANLEDNASKITLRCSLEDGWLDVNKIFILSKKEKIKIEMGAFLSENEEEKEIDPKFKCEVNDLRDILQRLKTSLDNEEENLKNANISNEDKKYYEHTMLDIFSDLSFGIIDKSFINIVNLTCNLYPRSDNIYKSYFRKHLHFFVLLSPFNNRAFYKPFGYAGDYEMMNMIYRDPDEGNTLFAKLMNRYILGKTAPKAVRGRIKYIVDKITQLLNGPFREKKSVSIMNLGCGSCKEIQDLLEISTDIDKCQFYLVDANEEPLLYSQEILTNLKRKYGKNNELTFINKDVEQIIREKGWRIAMEKQDIIYAVGLFDYLSSTVSNRLVKSLYEILNNQGTMIIGNLNNNNDTKNFMEYVGEWYINHRTDDELLSFANGLPQTKTLAIERDVTKVCNFLVIQKTE